MCHVNMLTPSHLQGQRNSDICPCKVDSAVGSPKSQSIRARPRSFAAQTHPRLSTATTKTTTPAQLLACLLAIPRHRIYPKHLCGLDTDVLVPHPRTSATSTTKRHCQGGLSERAAPGRHTTHISLSARGDKLNPSPSAIVTSISPRSDSLRRTTHQKPSIRNPVDPADNTPRCRSLAKPNGTRLP